MHKKNYNQIEDTNQQDENIKKIIGNFISDDIIINARKRTSNQLYEADKRIDEQCEDLYNNKKYYLTLLVNDRREQERKDLELLLGFTLVEKPETEVMMA